MRNWLLVIVALLFYACGNSDRGKDKLALLNKPLPKSMLSGQRLTATQNHHEIYGVFDVSRDTIILLRRFVGIEMSPDRGKTWTWLAKSIFRMNEFTIDNRGNWWGLEYWIGIHEASYCRIHFSTDAGKTWKSYEFDTNKFFPYHIYSLPDRPLEIVDYRTRKVFKLGGNNPVKDWKGNKQLPNNDNLDLLADLSANNYYLSKANDNNKLYVKRQNASIDTLINFPKAYNIYSIEKVNNTLYIAGSAIKDGYGYFAVVVNEHLYKDFTISGGDFNLTTTRFGHVYLTTTNGAYQYKKDTLIQIFK